MKIQSVRFKASLWSPAKAKAWLKAHGLSGMVEEATGSRTALARRSGTVVASDALAKVVYVAVLVPGERNSHGQIVTAAEARRAAHRFATVREVVMDHRVHPEGWPDGADAIIAADGQGGSVIVQGRFDRKHWTEPKAREFLGAHGVPAAVPAVLDDGPERALLVENCVAPQRIESMHGQPLDVPLPEGTWYIGAHRPEWTADQMAAITGASIYASFVPAQ